MSSSTPFRSNSPSNASNSGSRTKFPFILMPVSKAGSGRNTEECDLVLPSLHVEPMYSSSTPPESTSKAARRNAIVQRELRSRFPPRHSSAVEGYSAHDQLRRPARSLYPSHTISQTNLVGDSYTENPGTALLFNGIPLPPGQIHDYMHPRVVQMSRNCVKYRIPPMQQTEVNGTGDGPHASASSSTPQLVTGRAASGNTQGEPENQNIVGMKNEMDRMGVELREKDRELLQLKSELVGVMQTLDKSTHEAQVSKTQCITLRLELTRLEQQIDSLEERFDSHEELNGLKEFIISQLALSVPSVEPSTNNCTLPKALDYDRLINMIRELNSVAGNYQSVELCFTSGGGGATFKPPGALGLTLYRNGITLDDTDFFRPFDAATTAQFVQDIYDGYFPTELQEKYPDGITLVVKDKRNVLHPGDSAFPGKGKHLTESDLSQCLPKFHPDMKLSPTKTLVESTSSVSSIASIASETSYERLPDLLPTPKSLSQTQRALYKNTPCKFLMLKLKNLKTEISYKLKTTVTATPDDVLLHLETHLVTLGAEESGLRRYELINSYPFGSFSLGGATFREYGITSNSLIFFRLI